MAKTYPTWDRDKYNCINSDLSGIFEMIKLRKREQKLKDMETRLQQLKKTPLQGLALRNAIEEDIIEMVKNSDDRDNVLCGLLEHYRKLLVKIDRHHDPEHIQLKNTIVFRVLRLYMRFDYDTFAKDFTKHFEEEIQEKVYENERLRITASRKGLRQEIKYPWERDVVGEYFRRGFNGIPSQWEDMSVRRGHKKVDIAKKVFGDLIKDWRKRAPYFSEPVNVNGVSLNSLPADMRMLWIKAYELLSLGDITKKPLYIPFQSNLNREKTSFESMPVSSGV